MEAGSIERRVQPERVIRESFRIYAANAATLILSALVVFIVVGIIEGLLREAGGLVASLVASAVNLAGVALYTGFVVKLVEDVRDGRRDFSAGQLFSSASSSIGALIVNSVFRGIAIAIGFLLLIVPGLILLTIWAVCSPAIVAERRGAFEAFGRSRELVRGNGMPVFLTILFAFLIQIGVGIIAAAIGVSLGTVALIILAIVVSALTAPIFALVSSVLFFDLRGRGPASPGDDSQTVVEY